MEKQIEDNQFAIIFNCPELFIIVLQGSNEFQISHNYLILVFLNTQGNQSCYS